MTFFCRPIKEGELLHVHTVTASGIVVGFMRHRVKWEVTECFVRVFEQMFSSTLFCSLCTACFHSIKSNMKTWELLQIFALWLQGVSSWGCSKLLSSELLSLFAAFGWCNKWFNCFSESKVLLGSFPEALTPAKRVKNSRQLLPAFKCCEKSLVKDPVFCIGWESDNVPL